jgi:hypothetical protein
MGFAGRTPLFREIGSVDIIFSHSKEIEEVQSS